MGGGIETTAGCRVPHRHIGFYTGCRAYLGACVPEGEELVGALWGPGQLRRARKAEQQQVQDEAVVLRDERGKLQAADEAVAVGVAHVLVRDHDVVLGRDVVGYVVVHNEAQKPGVWGGQGGGGGEEGGGSSVSAIYTLSFAYSLRTGCMLLVPVL